MLDIELQQNTSSESMEGEEISMFSQMTMDFRVDSIEPGGLIHMSVRYSNLLFSMLAHGMSLDINSGRNDNQVLSDLIDSIRQATFHLTMTASGELQSLEGMTSLFQSLAFYPARDPNELDVTLKTLDEAYGPNAFRSMFNLFITFYPTVQPIKNWTKDITYYFNTKPVKMVNRYFLTRATEELVIIQGMGMLNSMKGFRESTSWGEVESAVSGTQTYDYQIDRETGWLRQCVSRQRVLIETTIIRSSNLPQGLKIPSYTETVFEVKGKIL